MHEDAAVIQLSDRKRGRPVIVRRTPRDPAIPRRPHTIEPIQKAMSGTHFDASRDAAIRSAMYSRTSCSIQALHRSETRTGAGNFAAFASA
jgi:hypothetical protein